MTQLIFRGIHAVNLDNKGRFSLPSCYRTKINDEGKKNIVITIDSENPCLLLYLSSTWYEIEKKINELPNFNPLNRRIQRLLIGHASKINIGNYGRIHLPSLLREYAKLEKNLILLGQGNKFELWDKKLWTESRDKWIKATINNRDELPQELQNISL